MTNEKPKYGASYNREAFAEGRIAMTANDTNTIGDYEKWSGKQLMRELQIELQIMDNRRVTGVPLKADEYLVTISRERYETLCRLALGRIEHLMRDFT